LVIVAAGSYPHTIENGAGEQLTFIRLVRDAAGDWLEVENVVKPGSGPPMHVHLRQEEALTVQQGQIAYQRPGEEPRYASEGDTVVFKAGDPHRFWNPGEGDLRCTGYVRPADNLEYFLTEIYASQKRNGGRRPDSFDAAFLVWRYRSEFAMVEIPAFVRRFVLPVQILIGRILGKYRRYAGAPVPVR
jgi:quercetin dioxygenase-like cupin family protein